MGREEGGHLVLRVGLEAPGSEGQTVVADGDKASFAAPEAGTGLVLGRDGTSTSFMPLHGLTGRWEAVTFDLPGRTVTVTGDGFAYTYRVPPGLGSS